MSQFLPEGQAAGPGVVDAAPKDVVSDGDLSLIRRVLAKPEVIAQVAPNFFAYMVDYLSVNQPLVPLSLVAGFQQTKQQARVYKNTTHTISDNTVTDLTFQVVDYDKPEGLIFSAGANTRLTVNVAGRYVVAAQCAWKPNATGSRDLILVKNTGTELARDRRAAISGSDLYSAAIVFADFAVGDYVRAQAYQDSGSPLDVYGTASTNLSIMRA